MYGVGTVSGTVPVRRVGTVSVRCRYGVGTLSVRCQYVRRAYVASTPGRTSGVRRCGVGPYVGSYVGSSRRTVKGPLLVRRGYQTLVTSAPKYIDIYILSV